jgi:transcription elongation factor Elf1
MEEFRVCLNCGYKRGFHVSFKKMKGKAKMILICPNCGQSYDIGWTTTVIRSLKPEGGATY